MTTKHIKKLLHNTFTKHVQFDEPSHTYKIKGVKYPSSTTGMIGTLHKPFDEVATANRLAKKRNTTPQALLDEWKEINVTALKHGSAVHNFLEYLCLDTQLLYLNKEQMYAEILPKLSEKDVNEISTSEKTRRKIQSGVMFLSKIVFDKSKRFKIVGVEQRLFLEEFLHVGTADLLLWDRKKKSIVIADWKTNKDLFKRDYFDHPFIKNKRKLYKPFDHLYDRPYGHYTIQFSHYQMMLENKLPQVKVSDRWLVWLQEDEGYHHTEIARSNWYTVYRTEDLSQELYEMFCDKHGKTNFNPFQMNKQ